MQYSYHKNLTSLKTTGKLMKRMMQCSKVQVATGFLDLASLLLICIHFDMNQFVFVFFLQNLVKYTTNTNAYKSKCSCEL